MQITDSYITSLSFISYFDFQFGFLKALLLEGANSWHFPYEQFSNESIIWIMKDAPLSWKHICLVDWINRKIGFRAWLSIKFWKSSLLIDWFWEVCLIYSLVLRIFGRGLPSKPTSTTTLWWVSERCPLIHSRKGM